VPSIQVVHDPTGIEGTAGSTTCLGFFDMETELTKDKKLAQQTAKLSTSNAVIKGYEIHSGITQGPALNHPLIISDHFTDGAISEDNNIIGTYLHGLFDEQFACNELLNWAGLKQAEAIDYSALKENEIDRLADAMEKHIDIDAILKLLNK